MYRLTPYIQLIRPNQWIKNTFIFLPLFFGGRITDTSCWVNCIFALLAFCFASSSIYCLNDIQDAEFDKNHNKKGKRPVANGTISRRNAYTVMLACGSMSLAWLYMCFCQEREVLVNVAGILLLYLLMNIAYCYRLKHYCIIDVTTIAIGFILRLCMGGAATGIELSKWIVLMTFLLSLFLAFAKRRDDVAAFDNSGIKMRENINRYSKSFIDQILCILASIIIVCYIMYTISDEIINRIGNEYLYTTSIFVLLGIIRYLQITIVFEKSGSPTDVVTHDRFIIGCITTWFFAFAYFLYFYR